VPVGACAARHTHVIDASAPNQQSRKNVHTAARKQSHELRSWSIELALWVAVAVRPDTATREAAHAGSRINEEP